MISTLGWWIDFWHLLIHRLSVYSILTKWNLNRLKWYSIWYIFWRIVGETSILILIINQIRFSSLILKNFFFLLKIRLISISQIPWISLTFFSSNYFSILKFWLPKLLKVDVRIEFRDYAILKRIDWRQMLTFISQYSIRSIDHLVSGAKEATFLEIWVCEKGSKS